MDVPVLDRDDAGRIDIPLIIRSLFAALVAWLAASASAAPALAQAGESLAITFADVGQGDATLIRTPRGKYILVDAGPSDAAAAHMFLGFASDTIDLVVASHGHADHIGGMPWVFQRFAVRRYMDNGVPHTTNVYRRTLAAAERERGLQYLQATERVITVDSVTLRILPPARLDGTQNNNSVGILVEYGRFSALLTGDSERKQLAHWLAGGRVPRVTVVKAAHHGARNGVTEALVLAALPEVVVVSVGARNGYGHPATAVIQAWTAARARLLRTDRDGAVLIVATPDGRYSVRSAARNVSVAPPSVRR